MRFVGRTLCQAMAVMVCLACWMGGGVMDAAAQQPEGPPLKIFDDAARQREILKSIQELKSPKVSVRQAAASALGCTDPKYHPAYRVALPALHEALNDPEPFVRMNAARAIGILDPDDPAALPVLLALLHDADAGVRGDACRELWDFAPRATDAIPALINRLRDESPEVRANAAWGLGQFGPAAADQTVGVLGPLLRDPDGDVPEVQRPGARQDWSQGAGRCAGPAGGCEGP